MSYESQVRECAACRNSEGPYTQVTVPQFSANGARPDMTVFLCQACKEKQDNRQKAWAQWTQIHGH